MSRFAIGIDTGGTYTDAVIVDTEHSTVIATAKAPTTHGELNLGIHQALRRVLAQAGDTVAPADVAYVSISTTLATNALVEGHGCAVTVFLIGFNDAMAQRSRISQAIPDANIVRIEGGHAYTGEAQGPLDTDAIRRALRSEAGNADAFAVAAHYSVRNPSHERQAQKLVAELTGAPVTASCDLSASLDGPRRALTAAFNARIVPLLVTLLDGVAQAMRQCEVDAPILIVKGDGAVADAQAIAHQPIETILCGPAASVIGARFLSGLADFVIADIGGTTCDVATVRQGWPGLNAHGANVGGFRTLVKAIDMHTSALGGDSEVQIDPEGMVHLQPHRVIPISMLAAEWPQITLKLKHALSANSGMLYACHYIVPTAGEASAAGIVDARDRQFFQRLKPDQPTPLREVVGSAADRACLRRLSQRGVVRQSGFTPSDAAHVLGLQSQWVREAAMHGCELLGRASGRVSGKDVEPQLRQIAREVRDAVAEKSTRLLVEQLAGQRFAQDDPLVQAVARRQPLLGELTVQLTPALPIVAVGGPAEIFFKGVGERLNCTVRVPKHAEVANAVGAAVGHIKIECTMEITQAEDGAYLVHGTEGPIRFDEPAGALEHAQTLAREIITRELQTQGGAGAAEIEIAIDRIDVPGVTGENSLISARVRAAGQSRPMEQDVAD